MHLERGLGRLIRPAAGCQGSFQRELGKFHSRIGVSEHGDRCAEAGSWQATCAMRRCGGLGPRPSCQIWMHVRLDLAALDGAPQGKRPIFFNHALRHEPFLAHAPALDPALLSLCSSKSESMIKSKRAVDDARCGNDPCGATLDWGATRRVPLRATRRT